MNSSGNEQDVVDILSNVEAVLGALRRIGSQQQLLQRQRY